MNCRLPRRAPAFTLIELLVVVGIIAILAAIAVPNFLQAMTRAKVARVSSDLKSFQTAMESYRVDNNNYPPDNFPGQKIDAQSLVFLTTPIAYVSTIFASPFDEPKGSEAQLTRTYQYWLGSVQNGAYVYDPGAVETGIYWRLTSVGPDDKEDYGSHFSNAPIDMKRNAPAFLNGLYDPTNGSVSPGDIIISNIGLSS